MIDITKIYDFSKKGIDTSTPGFYNDPVFLKIEHNNPSFLNEYNKFVMGKTYTNEYYSNAKKKIDIICQILFEELTKTKRNGACIDISQVLMLILEKEGIWTCMFDGSMTIEYNKELKIKPTYFHTVDDGNFSAAHAWVAAPPYSIIDLSISLQKYDLNEKQYIPNYVLTNSVIKTRLETIDLVSPRMALSYKTSLDKLWELYCANNPSVLEFLKYFPPVYFQSGKSKIKYIALHASASDGNLKSAKNLDFCGKTPYELYNEKIKPKLREI
jgi:hypothetical protein